MLLPCKRTAITPQKQCFLQVNAVHTKRDDRPNHTKENRLLLYLEDDLS